MIHYGINRQISLKRTDGIFETLHAGKMTHNAYGDIVFVTTLILYLRFHRKYHPQPI